MVRNHIVGETENCHRLNKLLDFFVFELFFARRDNVVFDTLCQVVEPSTVVFLVSAMAGPSHSLNVVFVKKLASNASVIRLTRLKEDHLVFWNQISIF